MSCTLVWRSNKAALGLLVLAACTRANPGFGDDTGSGSGDSSDTNDDDSVSASTTMTTSASTTADPTDTDSETGEDAYCGDAHVDEGEECDKGEDENDDMRACTSQCRQNVCGDGLRGPGQPCDDGNDIDDDACSNDCIPDTCGNGKVDEGVEECDQTAPSADLLCTPACQINVCHDGFQLGEEKCDDGNLDNDDACVDECAEATCNDGHVHNGVEACDDGNTDENDACIACAIATCGDGFVQIDVETCDIEAEESFGCQPNGFFAGEGSCTKSCDIDLSNCTNCGDGIVQEGEECDFGGEGPIACGDDGDPWQGEGSVECTDQCQFIVMGDCCAGLGQPCDPLASNDLCCGQCNENTSLCEAG